MSAFTSVIAAALAAGLLFTSITKPAPEIPEEERYSVFLNMPNGVAIKIEEAPDTCSEALRMGDAATAMTYAVFAYRAGSTDVIPYIAMMYLYGMGVEENPDAALIWLRRGAEQNNAACAYELGLLYNQGYGVPTSRINARHYFQQAARNGESDGYLRLYELDRKLDRKASAFTYAGLAAMHGNAEGLDVLGECYELGYGTDPDVMRAIYCYERAAEQGNTSAMNHLANIYISGDASLRNVTLGLRLYERALELGDMSSAMYLGELYEEGKQVEKNIDKAIDLYKLSAAYGNLIAEYRLDELLQKLDQEEE